MCSLGSGVYSVWTVWGLIMMVLGVVLGLCVKCWTTSGSSGGLGSGGRMVLGQYQDIGYDSDFMSCFGVANLGYNEEPRLWT